MRLDAAGVPVSIATLSYWQSGRSLPTRSRSYHTLVELERILFDSYALAVFYDSAAVMNDFTDYTMISGAGIGFHWNAPFGQLRLDLAAPVEDVRLKTIRIHFTLGTDL